MGSNEKKKVEKTKHREDNRPEEGLRRDSACIFLATGGFPTKTLRLQRSLALSDESSPYSSGTVDQFADQFASELHPPSLRLIAAF